MKAKLVQFGEIEIDGERYTHDVIIDGGEIRKRSKKPSKPYKAAFGHTPLSLDEALPWGGERLLVGTGSYGQLPIMDEVQAEAYARGVRIVAKRTEDVCALLDGIPDKQIHAVLHVTC